MERIARGATRDAARRAAEEIMLAIVCISKQQKKKGRVRIHSSVRNDESKRYRDRDADGSD